MHSANSFITLTYNDEHLPDDQSIDLRHWQLFAKKLRNKCGPFRFYNCGEYGDESGRPHYHACIFGLDFSFDRKPFKMAGDHQLYTSECLGEVWGLGFTTIGELSFESAAYVARYVMKKRTGAEAALSYFWVDEYGKQFDVRSEFSTMSRRPGIGRSWYDAYKADLRISDSCVVKGREQRPPAYYDSLFKVEEPEAFEAMKAERVLSAAKHALDQTPDRLAVREAVQAAKDSPHRRDFLE